MSVKFYLYHHWWKGSIIGKQISHYDLRFDEDKSIHRYFRLDKNPTFYNKKIVGVKDKCDDDRWLTFEGIIEPRGEETRKWLVRGNPNKRIVAHVDRIDSGKVNIISDTPMFISFIFFGKEIKGYWILKKATPKETVWTFEKSELPKSYDGKNLEDKRNLQKITPETERMIVKLTKEGKNRPDIASENKICQATVYYYQKLYGLV